MLKRWNKECYYQKKTERSNCKVKMMPPSGDSDIISEMPFIVDIRSGPMYVLPQKHE